MSSLSVWPLFFFQILGQAQSNGGAFWSNKTYIINVHGSFGTFQLCSNSYYENVLWNGLKVQLCLWVDTKTADSGTG